MSNAPIIKWTKMLQIKRMNTCTNCIHTALPFHNRRNLDFDSTVADEATIHLTSLLLWWNLTKIHFYRTYKLPINITNIWRVCCYDEILRKYTSIAHINYQSTLPTFDEFAVMMKSYEFDIIFLRETWLTININ